MDEHSVMERAYRRDWLKELPGKNDAGFYLIFAKAHFNSTDVNDVVTAGKTYLFCDYWTGDHWEDFNFSEQTWEFLYCKNIKDIHIDIPVDMEQRSIEYITFTSRFED